MSGKILIVAGTYEQARSWANDAGLGPKQWVMVNREEDLFGRRGSLVAFVGKWNEAEIMADYSRESLCDYFGLTDKEGKPK